MSLNNARNIILVSSSRLKRPSFSSSIVSSSRFASPPVILSGKGGVGKSSITTQLALALCLQGLNVGVLDVDLTGPSIPRLLGIEDAKIRQAPGGWLPVQVHGRENLGPVPEPLSSSTREAVRGQELANGHTNGIGNGRGYTSGNEELIKPGGNLSQAPHHTSPSSSQTNGTPSNNLPSPTHFPSTQTGSLHALSLALLLPNRSTAIIWRGPKKTAMVRQLLTSVLWPPLDYLLIDTPPGTSDEHIALVESLLAELPPTPAPTPTNAVSPNVTSERFSAILTTTPQGISTSDVRKQLNFCRRTATPILGVVENMAGYVCECCGEAEDVFGGASLLASTREDGDEGPMEIDGGEGDGFVERNGEGRGGGEEMAREFGVRFLGRVPLDGQWGVLVEEGRRPVYGGVERGSRRRGVDQVGDGEEMDEGGQWDDDSESESDDDGDVQARERDPALLVDKYRSCSLAPIMAGVVEKVVNLTRLDGG